MKEKPKVNLKDKYTVPNYLLNRYNVASTNKIWTLDDTKFSFKNSKDKLSVLIFIDVGSRKVIKYIVTKKNFNAHHIFRAADLLIKTRLIPDSEDQAQRLIIHTDRDNHFTSKIWMSLQEKYPKKIQLSMSEQGKPKQNAVSERFHRTLKNMNLKQVNEFFDESNLRNIIANLEINDKSTKELKELISQYIDEYNSNRIHSTLKVPPDCIETAAYIAKDIIHEPEHFAARNDESSPIEDIYSINDFRNKILLNYNEFKKSQNLEDLTPNDLFLLNQIDKVIQRHALSLAQLTQAQYQALQSQLEDVETSLEELKKRQERKAKEHKTLPLRDPVLHKTFLKIIDFPILIHKKQLALSLAQFKINCVIMYLTGCRINETKRITKDELLSIDETKRIPIIQTKTNSARFAYIGPTGRSFIYKIADEIDFVFNICNLSYLGCSLKSKKEVMDETSWIRAFNREMKRFCKMSGLDLVFKSHSMRIGYVTRCLSLIDIDKAAQLVGHKSVVTTQRYNRYMLGSDTAMTLNDEIFSVDLDSDENSKK